MSICSQLRTRNHRAIIGHPLCSLSEFQTQKNHQLQYFKVTCFELGFFVIVVLFVLVWFWCWGLNSGPTP
jgi:hypothetical protein